MFKTVNCGLENPESLMLYYGATAAFMQSKGYSTKTTWGWESFRENSRPAVGLHNEEPRASDVCRDLIKVTLFGKAQTQVL